MYAERSQTRAPAYLPSPEAIRQMAAEIRRSWSQAERLCRQERARLYQQRLLGLRGRASAA